MTLFQKFTTSVLLFSLCMAMRLVTTLLAYLSSALKTASERQRIEDNNKLHSRFRCPGCGPCRNIAPHEPGVGRAARRKCGSIIAGASFCLACFCALALVTSVQAEDIYVGGMKANKILFMGNSITFNRHDDNNGPWQNDWGMAATTPDKDFVHLVNALHRGPERRPHAGHAVREFLRTGGQYEQAYANFDPEVGMRSQLDWQPGIVVFAIGENVEHLATPAKQAVFAKSFEGMLRAFKKKCNPAIFVRGQFMGDSPEHDRIMKECCERMGGTFVNMNTPEVSRNPLNYAGSEKETSQYRYADGGLLSHPGNRGMKAIADAMFKAIQTRGAKLGDGTPPQAKAKPRLTAYGGVGDTWFVQCEGLTHVFYNGDGGYGHATSQDLIHWQRQPTALHSGPRGSYDDGELWSGCAVENQGLIHLFYCNTTRGTVACDKACRWPTAGTAAGRSRNMRATRSSSLTPSGTTRSTTPCRRSVITALR